MFAFDEAGTMGAGHFVNLEPNPKAPIATQPLGVLGSGTYHGDQWKISTYVFRLPILGPYMKVFAYNTLPSERKLSIWAYLIP